MRSKYLLSFPNCWRQCRENRSLLLTWFSVKAVLICNLYGKVLTPYAKCSRLWRVRHPSRMRLHGEISEDHFQTVRVSRFEPYNLFRGAQFHPCEHDFLWLICLVTFPCLRLAGGLFPYFSMSGLCIAVLPYSTVIHNTHWALLCRFIHFETFLPWVCVVNLLNSRTSISLTHTLFLAPYLSAWNEVSELIEYCKRCARFGYISYTAKKYFPTVERKRL